MGALDSSPTTPATLLQGDTSSHKRRVCQARVSVHLTKRYVMNLAAEPVHRIMGPQIALRRGKRHSLLLNKCRPYWGALPTPITLTRVSLPAACELLPLSGCRFFFHSTDRSSLPTTGPERRLSRKSVMYKVDVEQPLIAVARLTSFPSTVVAVGRSALLSNTPGTSPGRFV